jgi:hypothetical protein
MFGICLVIRLSIDLSGESLSAKGLKIKFVIVSCPRSRHESFR